MSRGGSPSSAAPKEKKRQRNDDELGRLTIICYTWKKCRRCRRARRRPTCCHYLGFFSIVSSLTTLPPNASLGILWSHWLHHHLSWVFMISLRSQRLHHHLMHLLGFCDFTHCITTWCISWDFMISLIASPPDASPGILWSHSLHHHLHHHLMHLLGFYDLTPCITTCITTWCIFWDFVISLTASPLDASLGFLWFRWLHHHLMHLLGFCDFADCITTWCIS
jgi:hypothetical protein